MRQDYRRLDVTAAGEADAETAAATAGALTGVGYRRQRSPGSAALYVRWSVGVYQTVASELFEGEHVEAIVGHGRLGYNRAPGNLAFQLLHLWPAATA